MPKQRYAPYAHIKKRTGPVKRIRHDRNYFTTLSTTLALEIMKLMAIIPDQELEHDVRSKLPKAGLIHFINLLLSNNISEFIKSCMDIRILLSFKLK